MQGYLIKGDEHKHDKHLITHVGQVYYHNDGICEVNISVYPNRFGSDFGIVLRCEDFGIDNKTLSKYLNKYLMSVGHIFYDNFEQRLKHYINTCGVVDEEKAL